MKIATIISVCGYCLGGLVCLGLAFVTGAQKNFFFGAVSFVSFFTLAVMFFLKAGQVARKDDKNG